MSNPVKNVNLSIDGINVIAPEGATILEAARKVYVKIPSLCNCPDLAKRAVCRLCVVECDGRGKLAAACASEVYEGLSVVTNNKRIMEIRKTIIELLLANHPQECLTCIRNKNCELQSLAEIYVVRETPFLPKTTAHGKKEIAGDMLVRDMTKCVKCGRCVEVCQGIQTVGAIGASCRSINYEIDSPFGQPLIDSVCNFCGQCAVVCPVGAIYEYDQWEEVWEAVKDSNRRVVAELAPSMDKTLAEELGLSPRAVTQGRIVTALKWIGFDKVYNAGFFMDISIREEIGELLYRIKNGGKLPMLGGCTPGLKKFVENAFPDLMNHLAISRSSTQIFGSLAKENQPTLARKDEEPSSTALSVSFMPCIAKKLESHMPGSGFSKNVDFTLNTRGLAQLIRQAGIRFINLPESPYDTLMLTPGSIQFDTSLFNESQKGITEMALNIQGTNVKALLVSGLANARKIMESIRNGECEADFVKIMSCPGGCTIRA